ncbi:MAG: hypothetical protein JWM76_3153 [Pseudonocardiales bacterium]|nr:hypothetical protein [Pseudonocardiales bacterium]
MRKYVSDDPEGNAIRPVVPMLARRFSSKDRASPPEPPQPTLEDEFTQIVTDLRRYDIKRFCRPPARS